MKSLENCQIVCNNAALATGPQPGSIVSPRGMRGASRREAWIERAGRENFVQVGHCKYCDSGIGSRLFILACYFYSVPLRLPRRHFAIRVFEARKDGHLRDSSPHPIYLRVSFRETSVVVSSKLPPLSLFLPSVFPSVVNYYREKESRIFFRFL